LNFKVQGRSIIQGYLMQK